MNVIGARIRILALALSLFDPGLPVAAQQPQATESEWSQVRNLAPATELIVNARGIPPARRRFVVADDFVLTVLNLDEPPLPTRARDALREVASVHPEYFSAAEKGDRFVFSGNVRLERDGVFVSDQKVAALDEVVRRYQRSDITEITIVGDDGNRAECAFAGYFLGAIVGGLPGALVGGVIGDSGGALQGMVAGWAIGGVAMYRRCRDRPDTVLYRAP